jgi:hypothetical protein
MLLPLLALALAVLACVIPVIPTPPTPIPPTLTVTVAPVPTPTATAVQSELTLDILKNGTYHAPSYDRTIKLVEGVFDTGSSSDPYYVHMLDAAAFGDLNGDGADDAAILLAENGGGSGVFVSLIIVFSQNGMPLQVGAVDLGDRVLVNAMTIQSGIVELVMLVHGPNDPSCCPNQPERQSYRMLGTSLWLTRVTTLTPDAHDRSFSISAPAEGSIVTNPFTVSGSVTISPFENTLACRIYLPDGTLVNEAPLMVDSGGEMGGPGTFSREFDLSNAGISGPVIIQFLDLSAADGSIIAMASVLLNVH